MALPTNRREESVRDCQRGMVDEEVMRAAREGRRGDAMRLMVEAWDEAVIRFCTGMLGDPHRAEDVAQEAFVAAWKGLDGFRGDSALRTWVFGIARRKCLDVLRARRRHLELVAEEIDERDPEGSLSAAQRAAVLRGCLAELDPVKRSGVLLRFGQDLPFAEIAAATMEQPDTAKRRVYRALAELRTCLQRKGVVD